MVFLILPRTFFDGYSKQTFRNISLWSFKAVKQPFLPITNIWLTTSLFCILRQNNEIKDGCNCRDKKYCPVGGKCLLPNIVYQEKITSSQSNYTENVFFAVAEKSFK